MQHCGLAYASSSSLNLHTKSKYEYEIKLVIIKKFYKKEDYKECIVTVIEFDINIKIEETDD